MSGWGLTLVYMCGPSVVSVETFVGSSGSAGTSSTIRLGYWGMSGSLISTTCGGGALVLPYPLLGSRHFPQDPYLGFPYLPLLVHHLLLVIPLHLHLNWHPLLGFLRLQ